MFYEVTGWQHHEDNASRHPPFLLNQPINQSRLVQLRFPRSKQFACSYFEFSWAACDIIRTSD